MSYFAKSLKSLRTQKGLTMQALADDASVSKSMICKIESDEVQPTLDVAARLAKALGKTLSEMLHTPQTSSVVFTPKDVQGVWKDSEGIVRRNISPVFEGLKIEWLNVELPPKTSVVKQQQVGAIAAEKYILVVKGILEMHINDEIFKLKKGDSIYFNAASAHSFINAGKETLEYYVVIQYT